MFLWHGFGRTESASMTTEQHHHFFWHHPITKVSSAARRFTVVQKNHSCTTVKQRVENGLAEHDCRFLFCLLISLYFCKWWITKMDFAKNGEVFQTAKRVQSVSQESFQVSHLRECIYMQNLRSTRDFQIWKGADSVRIWAETRDVKKTEGLCFWAEKMNLFYPAQQTLAVY